MAPLSVTRSALAGMRGLTLRVLMRKANGEVRNRSKMLFPQQPRLRQCDFLKPPLALAEFLYKGEQLAESDKLHEAVGLALNPNQRRKKMDKAVQRQLCKTVDDNTRVGQCARAP
eukprot:1100012-Amphidinium_carterae.1